MQHADRQLTNWERRRIARRRRLKRVAVSIIAGAALALPAVPGIVWHFKYASDDLPDTHVFPGDATKTADVEPSWYFDGWSDSAPTEPTSGVLISKSFFELPKSRMTTDQGRIYVPVSIKGKEYLLNVDTGAYRTMVTPAIGARLKPLSESQNVGGAFGPFGISASSYAAPDFVINGKIARNKLKTVLSGKVVEDFRPDSAQQYGGILGMDVLSNYVIQIDSEKRQFTICGSKEDLKGMDDSYACCEIFWLDHKPYIRTEFFAFPDTLVLLDTGCFTSSSVDESLISKIARDQLTPATLKAVDLAGNSSTISFNIHREWLFQGYCIRDVDVFVSKSNLFGLPFLARFNVTFDFPHKCVYFKKYPQSKSSST